MFGDDHNYMSLVGAYNLSRAIEFIIDNKLDDSKGVFNLIDKFSIELLRKYLAKKRI